MDLDLILGVCCRKTMAKWSEQVKVCSGTMVEGPLSDGYSWRKYGQKDILGANHPRLEPLIHVFFPLQVVTQ